MTYHRSSTIRARIREVLEITEALGECTTLDMRPRMSTGMSSIEMCKVCTRAVGLGLLRADRKSLPITYTVVPGWREEFEPTLAADTHKRPTSFDALLAAAVAMRPDVRTTWRAQA